MADSSLLASIISGTNPLAPQMLGAYQGAQQTAAAIDPNYAHNEGPFGALAKTLMGFQGSNALRQGVDATTAANSAASPDLAKLLANPDPYTALAGNYNGVNPIAASRLLQGATPESVAQARNLAAQAAYMGLNVSGFKGMQPTGTVTAPAGKTSAPAAGLSAASPFAGASAYPVQGADPVATAMDPNTAAAVRAATVAKMNPAQRASLRAALQAKLAGGGGNAARPQP